MEKRLFEPSVRKQGRVPKAFTFVPGIFKALAFLLTVMIIGTGIVWIYAEKQSTFTRADPTDNAIREIIEKYEEQPNEESCSTSAPEAELSQTKTRAVHPDISQVEPLTSCRKL